MACVRGEAFNRCDVLPGDRRDCGAAGARRDSVDMDRACSAELQAATELGAGQSDRVAQYPEQRHLRRDIDAMSFPIKGELNGWHLDPSSKDEVQYTTERSVAISLRFSQFRAGLQIGYKGRDKLSWEPSTLVRGEHTMTNATATASGAARTRPFTSQEYFESLRDGREIWIYGERVKDVTTHPAFRNTVRMMGRLYDALHDDRKATLCTETDTGNGGYTHKFFKAPRNAEEMVGSRDAIAEWARVTYGWMGRSPEYKAAFLATLGANSEFYDPFTENARRWYKKVQEEVTFVNHAIVNPPVDRNKQLEEVRDVYMHVEKETDAGLIVSGAKVVATTSTLTHYNFIANNGALPIKTKDFAFVCIVPTDAPGVKLFCRPSYEMTAAAMGSPFDYPLSSRMDENDSIIVFDKVFVPFENVFAYGDIET